MVYTRWVQIPTYGRTLAVYTVNESGGKCPAFIERAVISVVDPPTLLRVCDPIGYIGMEAWGENIFDDSGEKRSALRLSAATMSLQLSGLQI